jgi:hypothetical protein
VREGRQTGPLQKQPASQILADDQNEGCIQGAKNGTFDLVPPGPRKVNARKSSR